MRVLSLGAGVQSTALLLMALHGEFEGKPDCAIFADTQWEPQGVYAHLRWLRRLCAERWRFPVYVVTAGDIRVDTLSNINGSLKRFASMPVHVLNSEGQGAMLRRQCTKDYKITPVQQKIRTLLQRRSLLKQCDLWMGISADEWQRMKESRVKWITHRFPLVDRRMTRWHCVEWLRSHGYPEPPKSACIGCPFHDNALWREMKLNDPVSWREAVEFDEAIRTLPRIDGQVFLHRSLKPLSEVDLRNAEDKGQVNIWDFLNECEGMCGV